MSMTWMRRVVFAAALLALAPACGDSGSSDGAGKVTESPNLGEKASQMVTAADGGSVELPKSGVKLSIPAGALAADTTITAEVVSKKDLPDAANLGGNVVEFGPDGLTFQQPVGLEIGLAGATVPDGAEVSIAWLDTKKGEWVDLPGSTMADGKVTAQTTHFTTFAVKFKVNDQGQIEQTEGQCSGTFTACGGDIEGTWTIESGCADLAPVISQFKQGCPGAEVSASLDVDGSITFSGGRITGTLTTSNMLEVTKPKSCLEGMMCPAADPNNPDAITYQDKGDSCVGTQSGGDTNDVSSSYTVDGGNITIMDDGDTPDEATKAEFCVKGDTMTFRQNGDGISFQWVAKRK